MKILDIMNNEIVEYDKNTHYLVEETIVSAHYDEVPFIKEEGHYETVAEYPNGGKDVKWVIDIPGQEHKEAYDEYETILRLTEFDINTDEDMKEALRHTSEKEVVPQPNKIEELEQQIAELKAIINSLIKE